jgi:hypothetical protein
MQLWNHLPANAFGTPACKPSNFRKRVRKIITGEMRVGWKSAKNKKGKQ